MFHVASLVFFCFVYLLNWNYLWKTIQQFIASSIYLLEQGFPNEGSGAQVVSEWSLCRIAKKSGVNRVAHASSRHGHAKIQNKILTIRFFVVTSNLL